MTRFVVMAMVLVGAASWADETKAAEAEKKCAALKEDGSLIAEATWQGAKSDSCRAQLKAEVAKLCTADTRTIKYQLRLKEGSKPMPSIVVCPKAPAKSLNVTCFKGCSDTQKSCHEACAKDDKACNQKCLDAVKACNAGCQ